MKLPLPLLALALLGASGCDRTPDDEKHKRAALELVARGDYAAAVAEFDKAIALRPDKHRAYYMRGITRLKTGAKDAARADFETACGLKDRDACTMRDRLAAR